MPESLFDADPKGANKGYINLRGATEGDLLKIRQWLELLWTQYHCYADSQFPQKFAAEPESRFWEMYLTCCLLDNKKMVIPRNDSSIAAGDNRPDILIDEGCRRIWIEAVAPTSGEPCNINSVPPLEANNADDETYTVHEGSLDRILLRVTSAVKNKNEQLAKYRKERLIQPKDLSIIAITVGSIHANFFLDEIVEAARAVYPIGDQYVRFDSSLREIVESGRVESRSIPKVTPEGHTTPIKQTAFLDPKYDGISGLIWSRMSIGDCLDLQSHGLKYIHNVRGARLRGQWIPWKEEFTAEVDEQGIPQFVVR